MGNHHSTRNNPPNFHSSPKKQNNKQQRHSTGDCSATITTSCKNVKVQATSLSAASVGQHHPLVKPLALNLLQQQHQQQQNGSGDCKQSSSWQYQHLMREDSRRSTVTENEGSFSLGNNGRQLLVDFHASAKTPRHVRTIIDDEEDDNIEESFVMMRSGMIYSHDADNGEQCENPQASPSSVRTANIPIHSHIHTQLPTSPVSPHSDKKASSMPNLGVNSPSPKKKQALKLLAKIKNKFHHTNSERTSPTALQPSLSDSALSSRSAASCNNIQQQLSSSSLLKIDSHRSMQSYATTNSNNNSSATLVTNGQPNHKPLKMNEDGEYVDEDTYSNSSSESLDVSDSEHGDDEDYIEQFIQGTMVQTIDDSISYLKNSMRNQLA